MLLGGLLCALLAACATAPPPPQPVNPAIEQARLAESRGDWPQAAAAWIQAATDPELSNPDRSRYWLEAADAWWKAGKIEQAQDALGLLNADALESADSARLALLQGEMALAAGRLDEADFYLTAAGRGLPAAQRVRLTQAQQDLQARRQDPYGALLADIGRQLTVEPPDTTEALEVLQRLEAVPAERLAQEARNPTRLGQWCALSLDLRQTLLYRRDLLEAATDWATLNPLHPVTQAQYLEIAWQYGQRFAPPGRIAVLLPTEGSFAAAGAAVRDGIVAAWLDNPARSELVFMPVGEDPASALEAYRVAEREGFDWIIGPLRRDSVQRITDQPDASVPGLLLNWPEPATQTPFGPPAASNPSEVDFYSLSLSQEAEAEAVAARMLAVGERQAILLLADSAWGARTEQAFMDAYLAGGGEIVSLERFAAGDADHSAKLTRLLQIEDGRERRRRLQGQLGIPLEFEDSRRDDFGAFFMAADPLLGRQLKPQLRFFDAGSKPVFAMSRVYGGRPDPSSDGDLNGVQVPTTRWALREVQGDDATLQSVRDGAFDNLHALGRDAWNILPWLDIMGREPGFFF
ncbi:MAG: penicillin-binding protein activator, partial [Pseudomonadota bacterium]